MGTKKRGKPQKKEPLAPKGKKGRPTLYTKELGKVVCDRLTRGESLRKICKDAAMPEVHTVVRWVHDSDENKDGFHTAYEIARTAWADFVFDETMQIAETSLNVIVGDDRSDNARVNAVKLRIDTRKWFLSRMDPKKYGEKMDVTSGGKEIKEPRRAVVTYVVPKEPVVK